MLRIRRVLLTISLTLGLGSLSASLALGWYFHSEAYRRSIQQRVSDYLRLPIEIQSVRPGSLVSLRLAGVSAYLPDRRARVFNCARAFWKPDTVDDRQIYTLELREGHLVVGSQQWQKLDYRRVLESGLSHDFDDLKLKYVFLQNMDIKVDRPDWVLQIQNAGGTVVFGQDDGRAQADLQSNTINGFESEDPVRCTARFSPGKNLVMHRVELQVPRIPVTSLKLEPLLKSTLSQGAFAGRISYMENGSPAVEIAGYAENLLLPELTARMPRGSLVGLIERLQIDHARIAGGRLEKLEFRGQLTGLQVADFATIIDQQGVSGLMDLRVHRGLIEEDRVAELEAEGAVLGIDLEMLTEALNLGRITGMLSLKLRRLKIVNDQLVSAEMDAIVSPPAEGLPVIGREIVANVAENIFGTALPNLPFEELEYGHFGARLVIEGRQLRVSGMYGDGQQIILSVQVLGQELPVIRQPDKVFELDDLVALVREMASRYDLNELLNKEGQSPIY